MNLESLKGSILRQVDKVRRGSSLTLSSKLVADDFPLAFDPLRQVDEFRLRSSLSFPSSLVAGEFSFAIDPYQLRGFCFDVATCAIGFESSQLLLYKVLVGVSKGEITGRKHPYP